MSTRTFGELHGLARLFFSLFILPDQADVMSHRECLLLHNKEIGIQVPPWSWVRFAPYTLTIYCTDTST
jgi:hypothetical protein